MRLINPCSGGGGGGGLPAASDVPYCEQYSSTGDEAVVSISSSGVSYPIVIDTQSLESDTNNYFTSNDDGTVTSTYDGFILMQFVTEIAARSATGTLNVSMLHTRNGLALNSTRVTAITTGYNSPSNTSKIIVGLGDTIGDAIVNNSNTTNMTVIGLKKSGLAIATIAESDVLEAELFENPNIEDTDGFTSVVGCDLAASGGVLTATSNLIGLSTFTASVTGLTVSSLYRVVIPAARGVQGVGQAISALTWGVIVSTPVLLTSTHTFVFDVVATATSGTALFTVGATAAIGDEFLISGLSIRRYK